VVALEQLNAGGSIEEVYLNILQESLYETGRLWESNRISVAKEHMVTAIVQGIMVLLYDRIGLPAAPRGRVVVAGVRDELHQVGAHMIADVLECNGWDVRFLGTDMPNDGILRAIEEHEAVMLGISATMLSNVPHVVRLVNDVRARFPREGVRIIGGGAAFRAAPSLVDDLGIDGCATDLRSAITLADRLMPAVPAGE
jgi:methanogenic corrinoid protein MtbC1